MSSHRLTTLDAIATRLQWLLVVVATLAMLAGANRSQALDRDRTIDQFLHRSWTAQDGAPVGPWHLAQTTDGFLWIGTGGAGLYRFDGIRFESYEPRSGTFMSRDITALQSAPGGGLWIGFRTGGVTFLENDRAVNYSQVEGLPGTTVHRFYFDGMGRLWATTGRGLFKFSASHWTLAGEDWGLPADSFQALFTDHHGALWTTTADTLYRLPAGSRRFAAILRLSEGSQVRPMVGITASDGTVWVTDNLRAQLIAVDPDVPARTPVPNEAAFVTLKVPAPEKFMLDRDGAIWMINDTSVVRMPELKPGASPVLDTFTAEDKLSSNDVVGMLEDREGNVWFATLEGLDRFSRRRVIPTDLGQTAPYYGSNAMAAALDGSLWVAGNSRDHPLIRVEGTRSSFSGLHLPAPANCAYRDPRGVLWFGGQDMLAKVVDGKLERVPSPTGPPNPRVYSEVQAITADRQGRLWVSVVRHGVYRLDHGEWRPFGDLPDLPHETAILAWTDAHGKVWFGYPGNRVAVLDGDRVTTYSTIQGLALGNVTAITGREQHVWLGGEWGLALFDGARFTMLATWADDHIGSISGIVVTADGDLWLNQGTGVVHISAAAVNEKLRSHERPLRHELLDSRDGVVGQPNALRPLPSMVETGDGRIWLAGTAGVSWIDVRQPYRNPYSPPVLIRSLVADSRTYYPGSANKLLILPTNIQIDYTATSLSIPERVRFRYRLEGFDRSWRDVGTRRVAFYNSLGPGHYRFRVIAANEDGLWNEQGAAIEFDVPPAFYQTVLFRVACAALLLLFLWLLYNVRLRQIVRRFNVRLDERVSERTRIARELHDTLLQSFQGVILRFQAARNLLPGKPLEADKALEAAIDRAASAITEGRDAVQALRSQNRIGCDILQAISSLAEELAGQLTARSDQPVAPEFRLTVEGTRRTLRIAIRDDLYRIVAEALTNAFHHANARHIEVEIRYDARQLRLRIRDDGIGMDPELPKTGVRRGHWGVQGMRERARGLGAHLELWSQTGVGTEVEVLVPGAIAYANGADEQESSATDGDVVHSNE
jgi:signal transduction histidine kinase/ligand-binding sensor domain-containing protein